MPQTSVLQIQNLEKTVNKMDAEKMAQPVERFVMRDVSDQGAESLGQLLAANFPVTQSSVHTQVTLSAKQNVVAAIRAQRHPYVFFERGSQYPVARQLAPGGGGIRRHRTRRGILNSALRIQPRRYLSKTRAFIRRILPGAIDKAASQIEEDWAA